MPSCFGPIKNKNTDKINLAFSMELVTIYTFDLINLRNDLVDLVIVYKAHRFPTKT